MRIFLIATLLVLASCATNSAIPDLENRLSSWAGSSVHELAGELGEPTTVTENTWEWRFAGPGMQATASTSSLSQPNTAQNIGSSTGRASSPGLEGKTWTQSMNTSIPPKECWYRAKIDGVTIVEVETLVVSGRCRFGEIPLQAKNSSS
jgi:hypothetical protein